MMSNTFVQDFRIAEHFGTSAINDTYRTAKRDWQDDVEMMAGLVIALNQLLWYHYNQNNEAQALIYNDLWDKAVTFCEKHFKGEDLRKYYELTD